MELLESDELDEEMSLEDFVKKIDPELSVDELVLHRNTHHAAALREYV